MNHEESVEGCEEEVKAPARMLLGAAAREEGWDDAARPRPLQRHPPSNPWWQHQGAGGGLSDREKILMRSGSAFLRAELLPRGCRLAGWGGAFERFPGRERGRWLQGSAAASPRHVAGARLPPLSAVASRCAARSHIPARSV